jgi:uridine kinase
MHLEFIEPSKEFADIIIPNNKFNNVAIEVVRTLVREKLI